ncbi:hypothetical protein NC652_013171 [Populus alba x Populus x berolinensis]|nr:hypothetical protein NC652_013171 [Populus alba x Populus x berolinensis]
MTPRFKGSWRWAQVRGVNNQEMLETRPRPRCLSPKGVEWSIAQCPRLSQAATPRSKEHQMLGPKHKPETNQYTRLGLGVTLRIKECWAW